MSARVFVDANVLIYAATGREDAPEKYRRAHEIIESEQLGLSGQVIGEFFVNVQNKKKMMTPLSFEEALRWTDRLALFPFVDIDRTVVHAALTHVGRYKISYWDAAIVAAAERIGAEVIYTEDLNHGQTYGSVRVQNPFRIN